MAPIKNWSRRQDLEVEATKVWQHTKGDIIWVSHKVPNDGYYVNACCEDDWENRMVDSTSIGYSHAKSTAKQIGAKNCRQNPEGYF